jgi:hypothetical protein
LGWKAKRTTSLLPVAGDVFTIDFPLYRTRLPETDPLPSNGSGWQRLLFFASLLLLMSKMNRVRRFKDFRSVFLVDAFSC